MEKTYIPKKEEIKRSWFLIDAKDKILGRVAVKAARILLGKHKPSFSSHLDTGDFVVIINASKVRVSGKKPKQKVYRRYSGYPGGLKEISLEELFKKKPVTVMNLAVRRMLPKSKLGRKMLSKLKVYADDRHPHQAQNPKILEVN